MAGLHVHVSSPLSTYAPWNEIVTKVYKNVHSPELRSVVWQTGSASAFDKRVLVFNKVEMSRPLASFAVSALLRTYMTPYRSCFKSISFFIRPHVAMPTCCHDAFRNATWNPRKCFTHFISAQHNKRRQQYIQPSLLYLIGL